MVHYHGLSGPEPAVAALAFVALGSFTVLAIVLAAALGGPAAGARARRASSASCSATTT